MGFRIAERQVHGARIGCRFDSAAASLRERKDIDVPIEQLDVVGCEKVNVIRYCLGGEGFVFLHFEPQSIGCDDVGIRKALGAGELLLHLKAHARECLPHLGEIADLEAEVIHHRAL